jgi:hypothetical protein
MNLTNPGKEITKILEDFQAEVRKSGGNDPAVWATLLALASGAILMFLRAIQTDEAHKYAILDELIRDIKFCYERGLSPHSKE